MKDIYAELATRMFSCTSVSGRAFGKTAEVIKVMAKNPDKFITIKNNFEPVPVLLAPKWYDRQPELLHDEKYWSAWRNEQEETFQSLIMGSPCRDLLSDLQYEIERISNMFPSLRYELLVNERTARELNGLFKRDPGSLAKLASIPQVIIPEMKNDMLMVVPIRKIEKKPYRV